MTEDEILTTPDEVFAAEVQNVVRQIGAWMRTEKPDDTRLMPAMAVVLGRVIARSAASRDGFEHLMMNTIATITHAAAEALGSEEQTLQ